jgi:hypothetical protein
MLANSVEYLAYLSWESQSERSQKELQSNSVRKTTLSKSSERMGM